MEICYTLYFLHALYKECGIFKNRTDRSPRCSGPCGVLFGPNCASGARVTDKMVPPVQVSQLNKLGRYSALFLGMAYRAKRYNYLKPRAEEERRLAAEEKKRMSRSASSGSWRKPERIPY